MESQAKNSGEEQKMKRRKLLLMLLDDDEDIARNVSLVAEAASCVSTHLNICNMVAASSTSILALA